jgi:hypothetical protein
MPRKGQEINRGREGVVYENLDQPDTVVKEYYPQGGNPAQAGTEFQNLVNARAILPDNVVKAQPPANPRQGYIVKERVFPTDLPEDLTRKAQVIRAFKNIQDASGNLL